MYYGTVPLAGSFETFSIVSCRWTTLQTQNCAASPRARAWSESGCSRHTSRMSACSPRASAFTFFCRPSGNLHFVQKLWEWSIFQSMFMLWIPRIREWSNSIEILPVLKQHTELWDQCPEPQKRNARSWTQHHPLQCVWSTSPQVSGSVVSGKRHNIVLKQDFWDEGISADVGRIGISCAQALLL